MHLPPIAFLLALALRLTMTSEGNAGRAHRGRPVTNGRSFFSSPNPRASSPAADPADLAVLGEGMVRRDSNPRQTSRVERLHLLEAQTAAERYVFAMPTFWSAALYIFFRSLTDVLRLLIINSVPSHLVTASASLSAMQ